VRAARHSGDSTQPLCCIALFAWLRGPTSAHSNNGAATISRGLAVLRPQPLAAIKELPPCPSAPYTVPPSRHQTGLGRAKAHLCSSTSAFHLAFASTVCLATSLQPLSKRFLLLLHSSTTLPVLLRTLCAARLKVRRSPFLRTPPHPRCIGHDIQHTFSATYPMKVSFIF